MLRCWVGNTKYVGAGDCSIFAFATFICFGALYYKNISLTVLQRLLHETNVIVILILSCCIFVIEIIRAVTPTSSIMGFIYMVLAFIFVLFDVMKVKSRTFVVVVMATFLAINIFNVYGNTFGGWNHNIILLEYTIQGKSYMITKRSNSAIYFYTNSFVFCEWYLYND